MHHNGGQATNREEKTLKINPMKSSEIYRTTGAIPKKIGNWMFFCTQILFCMSTIAQSAHSYYSCTTTFSNDTLEIVFNIDGKKNIIKEPHKIPIYSYRIPAAPINKQATKADDTIRVSTLNYRLLDSLVWTECNNYRKAKGLNPVKWNDTIYNASSHHSEYQAYYNLVGHGEPIDMPKRKNEQVHYNKIRSFSGEICLIAPITKEKTTYGEAAQYLIKIWKDSPGHNSIMITPDYKSNAFGCAFRYHKNTMFTRENLLIYNPKLLEKIETLCPTYFKERSKMFKEPLTVWATGNFINSSNVRANMEFIENAEVVKNKNGTITYRMKTYRGGFEGTTKRKNKSVMAFIRRIF